MDYQNEIDLWGAEERFLGNEEFYKRFLFRFPGENRFEELQKSVAHGDAKEGFEIVHAMKGVVANLSLISLSKEVNEVTEILRGGKLPTEEEMQKLQDIYETTVEMIHYIETNDCPLFTKK